MGTSPSHNIFDEAGKQGKGLPSKKKEEAASSSPAVKPEKSKNIIVSLTDSEIQEMFDRMLEMRRDLDKKTDELKNAISLSQQDVVKFFSNSKNFTPQEWSIIQQSRSDLEKRVWAVVGKDPKKVREKQLEEKDTKSRKGKTLGSRRNWIPIR